MRDTADETAMPAGAGAETAPGAPAAVLARGTGIGPEIADAVLSVLEAAGAELALREVALGAWPETGPDTGPDMDGTALAAIASAGVLLKGPLAPGAGRGLRTALGLHCTLRRARSFDPVLPAAHPGMDVVVIRETEEDLPGGPEHLQTADVAHCVKRITRPGTERLCRIAFGYAAASGRRRIACVTKANAMPITDGLFRQVFEETAAAHPGIAAEALLIDTAAARLAARPERFDTLLAPNLYGDILSDVAAALAGHPQLATAVRFGSVATVFEPIHGPAPRLAGRGKANPSGLLLAACEMLGALGQSETAILIENAWARTLEDGLMPGDLQGIGAPRRRLGCQAFADAVAARLGERPRRMAPARAFAVGIDRSGGPRAGAAYRADATGPDASDPAGGRCLAGVDLTVAWPGREAPQLAARLEALAGEGLTLAHMADGGQPVWPACRAPLGPALMTGQWRCRFLGRPSEGAGPRADTARIADLIGRAAAAGIEILKTENLYSYGGRPGYGPA